MKALGIIILLLGAVKVFAFPSTIRHGYTSCMTCHYSPTGGGVLTSYGKVIAGELYSAFASSKTDLPYITEPKEDANFVAGFLARGTQYNIEHETTKTGKFLHMQTDLEAGVIYGPFYAFGTYGMRGEKPGTGNSKEDFFSRRYWVGARDLKYAFRAGKFLPEFGINHPNHNIATRQYLYFGPKQEFEAIQGNLFFKRFEVSAASIKGSKESEFEDYEGFTGQFLFKTDHSRTGISYLSIDKDSTTDSAYSVFTQMGLEDLYLLAEFAQRTVDSGTSKSYVETGYMELGKEFSKGFIGYFALDHYQGSVYSDSNYLGLKFYPITHFEIIGQAGYTLLQNSTTSWRNMFSTVLMFNVYF